MKKINPTLEARLKRQYPSYKSEKSKINKSKLKKIIIGTIAAGILAGSIWFVNEVYKGFRLVDHYIQDFEDDLDDSKYEYNFDYDQYLEDKFERKGFKENPYEWKYERRLV